MDGTPQFVAPFIELYKSFPCLWKVRDINYRNRPMKDKAYDKLLAYYQTTVPSATIDTVKRKINNLKSALRKELKKVKMHQAGSTGEETYKSKLWYFDLLKFTAYQGTPRNSMSSYVDAEIDENETDRVRTIKMAQTKESIESFALKRGDSVSETIMQRIKNVDLVSVKAKYHRTCYDTFRLSTTSSAELSWKRGRPISDDTITAMDEIYTLIASNDEECQFTLNELKSAVSGACPDDRTIIKRIKEKYGDQVIVSSCSPGKPTTFSFICEVDTIMTSPPSSGHSSSNSPSHSPLLSHSPLQSHSPPPSHSKLRSHSPLSAQSSSSKKSSANKRKSLINEAFKALKKEDEYDGIGLNVACKLRRMNDEQKLYAELLINKVILYGIRNRLQEETNITGLVPKRSQ